MSGKLDDILVDISNEYLDSLADIYRKSGNIPYASSLLRHGKKLIDEGKHFITFMSSGESWKQDGTFFALMQFPHRYQVVVLTLSASGEKIYDILMKTKRIDFDEHKMVFYALPSSLYPAILRVIEDKALKIEKTNINYIYTISKEDAMKFQVEYPPGIKSAKLEKCHSNIVNTFWSNAFPGSDEYVTAFIENNGGIGLFFESTNELVSWVLKTGVGKIGLLQTAQNHRKKGYASILTKLLSKQIAEGGENPTTNVLITNKASIKLMEKLGMQNVGTCYYITLFKRDTIP
ncbi:uncharacterized protein [Leptinotarsa decemlineata]|uniref:uncharacterized protein n=1 Tax=Leptinotarsa decemlineata TaxID=7539 RepID=UPI003D307FF9